LGYKCCVVSKFNPFSLEQSALTEVDEESGDEKENEEVKTEKMVKEEKGVRTDEDIMEEYGLADYDEEQVRRMTLWIHGSESEIIVRDLTNTTRFS
jgi:hypothetical protein